RQRRGVGSRNDESESPPWLWVDAKYSEGRRDDFVYRRGGQERSAFHDQLLYEIGRWPDDEVLERIAYEASGYVCDYSRGRLRSGLGASSSASPSASPSRSSRSSPGGPGVTESAGSGIRGV